MFLILVFLLTFFLVFEKVKWLCIKKIKRDITEVDEEHSTKQSFFFFFSFCLLSIIKRLLKKRKASCRWRMFPTEVKLERKKLV